jgi:hypothetical protein
VAANRPASPAAHPHHLQRDHEQHDHDDELHGLADVERAQCARRWAEAPPEYQRRHRRPPGSRSAPASAE